jgi:hypothetical protein
MLSFAWCAGLWNTETSRHRDAAGFITYMASRDGKFDNYVRCIAERPACEEGGRKLANTIAFDNIKAGDPSTWKRVKLDASRAKGS